MKNYIKPQLEILNSFSDSFCVITDVLSDNEVTDRLIISVEDELD